MAIAAGMVGALVMPHNIFLHSALVKSRQIDLTSTSAKKEAIMYHSIESGLSLGVTVIINLCVMSVFASGFHGQALLGITEVGLGSAGKCVLISWMLIFDCSLLDLKKLNNRSDARVSHTEGSLSTSDIIQMVASQ
jgi:NRAMP (natural resistance-associated macrophage protein)-like metal ion transporter